MTMKRFLLPSVMVALVLGATGILPLPGPALATRQCRAAEREVEKKPDQAVAVPSVESVTARFWYECPWRYRAAGGDRKAVHRLLERDLTLARALLAHADPERRRIGLGIAVAAADWAIDNLKDRELAVGICDEMLLPNLDAADKEHWGELSKTSVILTLVVVYRTAGEIDKWVEASRLRLDHASNRNSADGARIKLAEALAARGDYEEAILQLEGIDENGSLAAGRRLIPRYRQEQLKKSKQSTPANKESR